MRCGDCKLLAKKSRFKVPTDTRRYCYGKQKLIDPESREIETCSKRSLLVRGGQLTKQ